MKNMNCKAMMKPVSGMILKDFIGHGRMDLQMFADGDEEDNANASEDDAGNQDEGRQDEKKSEGDDKAGQKRTYDDAEVDRIVAKHKAQWEKAHAKDVEDAKAEAEKLAKMNREQKAQYEQEQKDKKIKEQQDEIDRLKKDALRSELSKTAARQMKEDYEIIATQDMLDFVVGDDAESTNANIKKLVGIIQEDRKLQEEKRATGRTPKNYNSDGGGVTDPYAAIANKYKRK